MKRSIARLYLTMIVSSLIFAEIWLLGLTAKIIFLAMLGVGGVVLLAIGITWAIDQL